MFPPKSPWARHLETPIEVGDANGTGGDLEGDLRASWGGGETPRALRGGGLDGVLGGDGALRGGESELGMAKEMYFILRCPFTTLTPSW